LYKELLLALWLLLVVVQLVRRRLLVLQLYQPQLFVALIFEPDLAHLLLVLSLLARLVLLVPLPLCLGELRQHLLSLLYPLYLPSHPPLGQNFVGTYLSV
jgi:hypothetical protein